MKTLNGLDAVVKHMQKRPLLASSRVSIIKSGDDDSSAALLALTPENVLPVGIDETRCSATFTVSTINRDRHGDIVQPKAFEKWLSVFATNPRGFFSHKSHELPIGSWRDPQTGQCTVQIFDDRLLATIFFHLRTDESRYVWDLVRSRELEAVSIGFLPHEAVVLGPEEAPYPENPETLQPGDQLGFDAGGLEFTEVELLEISVVPVPANRQALIERINKSKEMAAPTTAPRRRHATEAYTLLSRPPFNYTAMQISQLTPSHVKLLLEPSDPDPTPSDDLDPVRWNKSLSKAWDITEAKLRPARLEYDFVSRHVGCKVKQIYQNAFAVPSAKVASFLTGLRDALTDYELNDVRNITYDGRESPPVYETIQLNSKSSDSFLIEGLSFLSHKTDAHTRLVWSVQPTWYGLQCTLYSHVNAKEANVGAIEKAKDLAATLYNFLKGEAFSLSGEFLPRKEVNFTDLFLDEKNEKCLTSTLKSFNDKKLDFAPRGTLLAGRPGTGKTLSARVLLSEAADSTFIWVSARDFYRAGSFGGFAYAFELARELAPTILCFEDIDNWLNDRIIDLLKTEMDGLTRNKGMWTLLTTNFPEDLPDALIDRPGRFHDVLLFSLPDADVRRRMLQKWLPALSEDTLDLLTARTESQSGAHIFELCHFAKTLQEQEGKILSEAVEDALKKVQEQRELITATQKKKRSRYDDKSSPIKVKEVARYIAYSPQEAASRIALRDGTAFVNSEGWLTWCKGVIPFASHPKAAEDTAWDGPAQRAAAEIDDLKKMCAYYHDDGSTKSQYALPHHTADGCKTVWNGVRAAMAALLGARGGLSDVSSTDKRGIYNHLKKHYAEFSKEPPELKKYTEEELKSLFPEDDIEHLLTVVEDVPPITPVKEDKAMAEAPVKRKEDEEDDDASPMPDEKPDNHVVKSLNDLHETHKAVHKTLKAMHETLKASHELMKEGFGKKPDDTDHDEPDGDEDCDEDEDDMESKEEDKDADEDEDDDEDTKSKIAKLLKALVKDQADLRRVVFEATGK